MTLAKSAQNQGVNIIEKVTSTGIIKGNEKVTDAKTVHGNIKSDMVVNCTGMWARQIGDAADVNIQNQSVEHYYLITEKIDNIPKNIPVLEDPSHYGYYRGEVGGLMIGLFEPKYTPWKIKQAPETFSWGLRSNSTNPAGSSAKNPVKKRRPIAC
jgi:glycine/D-amino acid oxidase-like deaminating enzyme